MQATPFDEPMCPLTDVYLYAAARAQLLAWLVQPALARWAWVVSDRNVCSSLAYQWWTQWVGIETVRQINAPAVLMTMPTTILFFDLSVEIGMKRTFDAWGDKRESKGVDFFNRVYEGYKHVATLPSLAPLWKSVDVSGTPDEVALKIQAAITVV